MQCRCSKWYLRAWHLLVCSFLGAHERTTAESCEPVLYGWCTGPVPVLPPAVLWSSPLAHQELPKALPTSCPHAEMQGSRQRLDRFLYTAASCLMKAPSSSTPL
uniref:Secreted protein n=1 Tax=Opuntia streptacantha TaxID=393608 RepID=A0A7C9E833_OPUST